MNKNFLRIEDELLCTTQTLYFNKGMKYKIKNIRYNYTDDNDLKIMISLTDKFDSERSFYDSYFELPAKTITKVELRKKKTYAKIFWDAQKFTNHTKHLYDFSKTTFYEISRAVFLNSPDAIANISSYNLDISGPDGWKYLNRRLNTYIFNYEEFEKWFLDQAIDDNWYIQWNLPHISISMMEKLSEQRFVFDEKISYSKEDMELKYPSMFLIYRHFDESLSKMLEYFATISFDDINYYKYMGDVMCDVLDMFSYVPPSYGSTAITKFLMGKKNSIKKTEVMESLEGKYASSITYDQMFALCSNLEYYTSHLEIFSEKSQGDRPYWIGNRNTNYDKLQEFKKEILKLGK